MKMEITQRDVILLKVAFTILILVLGVRFLVMPQIEKMQESATRLEATKVIVDERQSKIDSISLLEQEKVKLTEEFQAMSSPYYSVMESREIDELITGIALKHKLFPMSLVIEEKSHDIFPAYTYSALAMAKEAEEALNEDDGAQASDESADESSDAVPEDENMQNMSQGLLNQNPVSFSVRGKEKKIMEFLNDLYKNYPSIEVKSFTIYKENFVDTDFKQVQRTVMECELIVFTCDEGGAHWQQI